MATTQQTTQSTQLLLMTWKICNVAGCPELTQTTQCDKHTRQREARRRGTKDKGYNTAGHKAFRTLVLHRDPICVLCGVAVATDADHYPKDRKQLVLEGLDPNDPKHGRGLCHACHSKETARNQPGGFLQQ